MGLRLLILALVLCSVVVTILAQDITPTAVPDEALVEEGREVFLRHGCVSCHGVNAQGSALAPALGGQSGAAIRRQIRAPLGIMPNYSPETITGEELDTLVAYIETLELVENPLFQSELRGPQFGHEVIMHHWLTLVALEAGDMDEARTHIEYVMTLVESTHLAQLDTILEALEADDLNHAQEIIEAMLADVADFEGSAATVHLSRLQAAVREGDVAEAEYQLEQYITVEDHDEALAAAITMLFEMGNLTDIDRLLDIALAGTETGEATPEATDDMSD